MFDDEAMFDPRYDESFATREHDYDPRGDYQIRVDQIGHPLHVLAQKRMDELATRDDTPFERGHVHPANLHAAANPSGQDAAGVYASGTYNEPVVMIDLDAHQDPDVMSPEDEIRRTVDHEVQHAVQESNHDGGDGNWADEDDAENKHWSASDPTFDEIMDILAPERHELKRERKEPRWEPAPAERPKPREPRNERSHMLKTYAEYVDPSVLDPYREYEWGPDNNRDGAEAYAKLRDHIAQYGFNEPASLEYNPDTGHAYLGEGNHRLAIAKELGIPIPVYIYRSTKTAPNWPMKPLTEPGQYRNENAYGHSQFGQYEKPSTIGLPTVPGPDEEGDLMTRVASGYWDTFWQGGPHLIPEKHAPFLNRDPSPPPPPPPPTQAERRGLSPAPPKTVFKDLARGDLFTTDVDGHVFTHEGCGSVAGWADGRQFSARYPIHSVLRKGEEPAAPPPAPEPPTPDYREPWEQTLEEFAAHPKTKWHGTKYGDIGGGDLPVVHLGDWLTAHEALAAHVRGEHAGKDPVVPETCRHGRPAMHPLRIVGPMHHGTWGDQHAGDPMASGENSAEGRLRGLFRRGVRPRVGYHYKNQGEGVRWVNGRAIYGTSSVVPHPSWLKSHADFVREALAEGKPVPTHVRAEYEGHLHTSTAPEMYLADPERLGASVESARVAGETPGQELRRWRELEAQHPVSPDQEVLHSFPDGWTIQRVGLFDVGRIGGMMRNCWQGMPTSERTYRDDSTNLDYFKRWHDNNQPHSLHDPEGIPRAVWAMRSGKPIGIAGMRNRPGEDHMLHRIAEWAGPYQWGGQPIAWDERHAEPDDTRISMAERSGFPELDAAIEEFMRTEFKSPDTYETDLNSYRNPENAHGQCEIVADALAEFLKQRGFKAYATSDDLRAFPGYENAQDAGGAGFMYPEHAMVEVYDLPGMGVNTVTIDFTASQYGFTEFPKVHPGPPALHQANILDPIHETLDPAVFEDPHSDAPHLRPALREWLVNTIFNILEEGGYEGTDRWASLYLTGSLTTYQYSDQSDTDVSIFVNHHVFPEWSRAEMIALMVESCDGLLVPGTTHPLQVFVVAKGIEPSDLYQPGLRSGYDLIQDTWVVPPERDRAHDPEKEDPEAYSTALLAADKMDSLLTHEPEKAKTYYGQLHRKRMADQKAGKGDYSQANIVYKMLNNRGLFDRLRELGVRIAGRVNGPDWPEPQIGDPIEVPTREGGSIKMFGQVGTKPRSSPQQAQMEEYGIGFGPPISYHMILPDGNAITFDANSAHSHMRKGGYVDSYSSPYVATGPRDPEKHHKPIFFPAQECDACGGPLTEEHDRPGYGTTEAGQAVYRQCPNEACHPTGGAAYQTPGPPNLHHTINEDGTTSLKFTGLAAPGEGRHPFTVKGEEHIGTVDSQEYLAALSNLFYQTGMQAPEL